MDEDRVDGPAKRSEYPQKSRKNSEAEISIFKLSGGVSGTICDHFTRPGRTGSVATYLAPSWCEVARMYLDRCRRIHAGQERERQREAKKHDKQRISLTPRPKETADLEFRRTPKFTQDCEHTHRTPSTGQYEGSILRQSGTGEFKNILRAPKGARHSCEVVSTDRPPRALA